MTCRDWVKAFGLEIDWNLPAIMVILSNNQVTLQRLCNQCIFLICIVLNWLLQLFIYILNSIAYIIFDVSLFRLEVKMKFDKHTICTVHSKTETLNCQIIATTLIQSSLMLSSFYHEASYLDHPRHFTKYSVI